jgi:hypothetical protein
MQPHERIIHAARMIVDRRELAGDDPPVMNFSVMYNAKDSPTRYSP